MTGKPANGQDELLKMEAGIATMESALNACYFNDDGSFRELTVGLQKRANLLFDGIRDMKAALFYARNGIVCPECMAISSKDNNYCCNCGLEFEM